MIQKIHGKFYLVCDICQKEVGPCDTWEEAKEAMYQAGCRRQEEKGEYYDVCRECRKQN